MAFSTLQKIMKILDPSPSEMPILPVGHLSKAKWFHEIVKDCKLKPRYCKIFKRKQLYFFYGGLLYRPELDLKNDASYLPVGLLFHPELLQRPVHFFPFDTGAMAKGLYGKISGPFQQYKKNFEFFGNGDPTLISNFIYHPDN